MSLTSDLRYSLRLLRKTPIHTLTTVFVLAIGLSLFLASYTMAKMRTNKPMPFPNGDRYVALNVNDPLGEVEQGRDGFDLYTYDRLLNTSNNYSVLAAIQYSNATFSDGENYSRLFRTATLSIGFLSATSVNPILGRLFTQQDSTSEAEDVAVISYNLWQDYYGGDPNIIGTFSRINNEPHNIIGVMPEGFNFPTQENLWLPLRARSGLQPGDGGRVVLAGILEPGVSLDVAEVELDALLVQLSTDFPDDYRPREATVTRYARRGSFSALNMGVMALIIACVTLALTAVNLSSLLFMRSISRKQELAVRATVGAGGLELAKQVLLESFIICMAGLLLSIFVSQLMLNLMESVFYSEPFWYVFELNIQSVLVGFSVAIIIWLASGLFVAFKAWSTQPDEMLTDTNKGAGNDGKGKLANAIVMVEVILSCFLLVLTGITLALLARTTVTEYGADIENTAVASLNLSYLDTGNQTSEQQGRLNFVADLIREVNEIPDITELSITTAFPGEGGEYGIYQLDDQISSNDPEEQPGQETIWVSENYFGAMGVNLIEGRGFDSSDSAASENVVIIADDFAEQLWPQESALGKSIVATIDNEERSLVVIGVIPEIIQTNTTAALFYVPSLYRPITQDTPENMFLVARYRPEVVMSDLAQAVRSAGIRADRSIAVEDFGPWLVRTGDADTITLIAEAFALGTFLLASIGVYAVLSRSIAQRTHEIGVRRALGSTSFRIFLNYGKQGFYFLLAGIVIGCVPAVIVMAYLLITVFDATDIAFLPLMTLAVALLMFLIIAVACYLPTSKAIRLEPGDALRYE